MGDSTTQNDGMMEYPEHEMTEWQKIASNTKRRNVTLNIEKY